MIVLEVVEILEQLEREKRDYMLCLQHLSQKKNIAIEDVKKDTRPAVINIVKLYNEVHDKIRSIYYTPLNAEGGK